MITKSQLVDQIDALNKRYQELEEKFNGLTKTPIVTSYMPNPVTLTLEDKKALKKERNKSYYENNKKAQLERVAKNQIKLTCEVCQRQYRKGLYHKHILIRPHLRALNPVPVDSPTTETKKAE
jgi:hypothetical protein